ncbi:MAG: M1 family metallopeptidase [Saprospiraceae bacterium]
MARFVLLWSAFVAAAWPLAAQPSAGAHAVECSRRSHLFFEKKDGDLRSDSIDIWHTEIRLDLTQPPAIAAEATLRIRAVEAGQDRIRLDLEGLQAQEARVGVVSAEFEHAGAALTIWFPQGALSPGEEAEVWVRYGGTPLIDPSGWGGVYHQSGYQFNLGVGFQADPHSFGRAWFPCFDNFVERCAFDFYVTTPEGRLSFCNGILLGETLENGLRTRHWRLEESIPSYLAGFAAGPYVSWERMLPQGVSAVIAAAPSDTANVSVTFANLGAALDCYEAWFGPYQWPRIGFALVPFGSGAMEHATNVAIMRAAVNGTKDFESLWAHELSHHWWGDLATCADAGDMWLNEGWAVYCEHLFAECVYGPEAYRSAVRDNFLNVLQNAHVNEGGYRALSGLPHALTYGAHAYNKGAVAAHNLRVYLGDSLFRVGVREALAQTAFAHWSSADFRDKLEAATGYDLHPFFENWVFGPGFPHFSIDSASIGDWNGQAWPLRVYLKQKLRGAPAYFDRAPLELCFVMPDGERLYRRTLASGLRDSADVLLPDIPRHIWINTRQTLTLARAERERTLTGLVGAQSFAPAKWDLNLPQPSPPAFLRVEHHFVMPDTGAGAVSPLYRLSNRYWTVDGDIPEDWNATATIFYDGRGKADQLDADLFALTGPSEDSIVLLYRPGPGHLWQPHPNYMRNALGNNSDRWGLLRILHIKPGQYAIAKGPATVSGHEAVRETPAALQISPNPADAWAFFSHSEELAALYIFASDGRELRREMGPAIGRVSLEGLAPGVYVALGLLRGGGVARGVFLKK